MLSIWKSRSLATLLVFGVLMTAAATAEQPTEKIVELVAKVQRANYESNRAGLKQLYGELAPYADNKAIATYERGLELIRQQKALRPTHWIPLGENRSY